MLISFHSFLVLSYFKSKLWKGMKNKTFVNKLNSYPLQLWSYVYHSGVSGEWEERTMLREKVTLKFISITLPILPTAVTIKLIKLES